jgi:hypothetical protein
MITRYPDHDTLEKSARAAETWPDKLPSYSYSSLRELTSWQVSYEELAEHGCPGAIIGMACSDLNTRFVVLRAGDGLVWLGRQLHDPRYHRLLEFKRGRQQLAAKIRHLKKP